MGNAFQKAAPGSTSKHSMLNNSQMSDATADRSLLNVTGESETAGTPLVVNDPRSPTDGISRTPIQVTRTKSLFRGIFSGRKPSEADQNAIMAAASQVVTTDDNERGETNSIDNSISVTASLPFVDEKKVSPVVAVKKTDENVGEEKPVGNGHLDVENETNIAIEKIREGAKKAPIVVTEDVSDTLNTSTTDHDITTENEEAFIVVSNKKKKKKREKAEAKAKEAAVAESVAVGKRKSLEKVPSDSKLPSAASENDLSPGSRAKAQPNGNSLTKHRLSVGENEASNKGFRVKVEKACRSLTNLTSSKSKSIAKDAKEGDNDATVVIDSNEASAEMGSSAPATAHVVGQADADGERENINNAADVGEPVAKAVDDKMFSGKYMVLVNDE